MTTPATCSWVEFFTQDVEAAKKFYGSIFGWTFKKFDGSPNYTMIQGPNGELGGIMENAGMSQWIPCFTVANVDDTLKKAQEDGGSVFMEPMDIPSVGRYAMITDPCGGKISIITLVGNCG